jgi:hypothetical protein
MSIVGKPLQSGNTQKHLEKVLRMCPYLKSVTGHSSGVGPAAEAGEENHDPMESFV